MYILRKKLLFVGTSILLSIAALLVGYYLSEFAPFGMVFMLVASVFIITAIASALSMQYVSKKLEKRLFTVQDTRLLHNFYESIRFAYTLDDFITALQQYLESEADCGVLMINKDTDYIIYNSPNRISSDDFIMAILERNFPQTWSLGYYFFNGDLELCSDISEARGFFFVHANIHLYIFCRFAKVFDLSIFPLIYEEFCNFQKRSQTITELSVISEISKEWSMVAETQLSFLPRILPDIKDVDIAAYFRPLVNVSGDYYQVLPITEDKTLFLLGDVSGKGLAAALVMGVVINTIKILQDKEDLAAMIRAVDTAIKGMALQDKYTVLFAGIIDTRLMSIRYVNASMSDPLILSQSAEGVTMRPLGSNCSLIGIIDIDEVEVTETALHDGDMVLMASDGISEIMDDEGIELGNSRQYAEALKNNAHKTANHFIQGLTAFAFEYNGDKKLRDDITILVAKIGKAV